MADTHFHTTTDGRRIAFRHVTGSGPAVVFLPGYMSDMAGSKATALLDWAQGAGRECLLLDYSGCGESPGSFAEGTLSRWRDEVLSLIDARINGPAILVGSSMGGWLMLLAGMALGERLHGLVGVAAAPDFTQWGYTDIERAALAAGVAVRRENPYGPEPTPTYPGFWADGQANRLLDGPITINCPVRLLHGALDDDVPPEVSLQLADMVNSADVQVTLVKGGDHRLSRAGDIDLLLRTVAALG